MKHLFKQILFYTAFNIAIFIIINAVLYLFLCWIFYEWQDLSEYSVTARALYTWGVVMLFIFPSTFGNFAIYELLNNKESDE